MFRLFRRSSKDLGGTSSEGAATPPALAVSSSTSMKDAEPDADQEPDAVAMHSHPSSPGHEGITDERSEFAELSRLTEVSVEESTSEPLSLHGRSLHQRQGDASFCTSAAGPAVPLSVACPPMLKGRASSKLSVSSLVNMLSGSMSSLFTPRSPRGGQSGASAGGVEGGGGEGGSEVGAGEGGGKGGGVGGGWEGGDGNGDGASGGGKVDSESGGGGGGGGGGGVIHGVGVGEGGSAADMPLVAEDEGAFLGAKRPRTPPWEYSCEIEEMVEIADQYGSDAPLEHMIDLHQLEMIVREQAAAAGDLEEEMVSPGQVALRELAEMLDQADLHRIGATFGMIASPFSLPPPPMAGGEGLPSALRTSEDQGHLHASHLQAMPVHLPGGSIGSCSTASSSGNSGGNSSGRVGGGGGGGGAGATDGRVRNTMGRKEWSAEEDQAIMEGVALHGQKWRVIAQLFPGRTDDAVRNRWKRLSAEMAEGLTEVLTEGLDGSAAVEPRAAAGAAAKGEAKQAANKERLAWSRAEDAKIVECVQSFGLKWSRIAEQLPGRTVHAIRNRFHRLQILQAEQAALAAAS